jgi:hypothetical protein
MKKLVFILPLLTMLLSGCNEKGQEKEYGRSIYRRSYAMYFCTASELKLTVYPETDKKAIVFDILTDIDVFHNDVLCEKYGDTTYDREEFVPIGVEPSFLAYSPVSIEIVSDADFDAEHPAGTSLIDIVTYDGQSSKPFIDSGYQMCYWEDKDKFYYYKNTNERPYYPVYKKVSELTEEDLMLIYGFGGDIVYGHLYFDYLPTLSQQHRITVTFTDERGEKFSDTVTMNFE